MIPVRYNRVFFAGKRPAFKLKNVNSYIAKRARAEDRAIERKIFKSIAPRIIKRGIKKYIFRKNLTKSPLRKRWSYFKGLSKYK